MSHSIAVIGNDGLDLISIYDGPYPSLFPFDLKPKTRQQLYHSPAKPARALTVANLSMWRADMCYLGKLLNKKSVTGPVRGYDHLATLRQQLSNKGDAARGMAQPPVKGGYQNNRRSGQRRHLESNKKLK
jgi:hypothetical protein